MPLSRRGAIAVLAAVFASSCSVSVEPTRETTAFPTTIETQAAGTPSVDAVEATPSEAATATDGTAEPTPTTSPATSAFADLQPGAYRAVVDTVLGHDPASFTQGLVFDGPRLFESRGLYGLSAITEIDPESGAVISMDGELRRVDLPEAYFAEGLALVDDRLIQLTWQEQTAFVWDADSLTSVGQFEYDGEGWGLCYDGADVWMSNGTSSLTRRDPADFTPLEVIDVTLDDQPVVRLNELECIHGLIWANVWLTDLIVVIDPTSGVVVATIDASGLLTDEIATGNEDVLNGIAYDARRDVVILTGKNWPAMFEISLAPA